jgi:hypothetical protein
MRAAGDATAELGGVAAIPGNVARGGKKRRGERGPDLKPRVARGISTAKKARENVLNDPRQQTLWGSGLPRHISVRRRQQGLRNRNQRDQQVEQSSASSSSCSSSSTSRSSSADTVAEIEVVVPVIAEEEKNGDADHSDGEDSHAPECVPRKLKVAQVSPFMVEKVKKIMTSYKLRSRWTGD